MLLSVLVNSNFEDSRSQQFTNGFSLKVTKACVLKTDNGYSINADRINL
jgi:hypothetical protein